MAEIYPLQGLRYQPEKAGDLGSVLAPPYDVISAEAQQALYARSPYNVVRLEYGNDSQDSESNRYQAAAATLAGWRNQGVLAIDPRPSLYLYEQSFQHGGRSYRRRSIIGRVRLEPWDAGVILPHEHTMNEPKQDRLRLLRACRTNISPVFSLYRPDGGRAVQLCEQSIRSEPVVDALDSLGQGHRMWRVDDPGTLQEIERHFSASRLYIADGHHRYETALAYRDERKSANSLWSDDEPEKFVLMALTAADDPGLLILPIHRLVRPVRRPENLAKALSEQFDIAEAGDRSSVAALLESMRREGAERPVAGCVGIGEKLLLLALRDREGVRSQMPAGHSLAWQELGVNVLQYGILDPLLGIDIETVRSGGHVEFTESAGEAVAAVDKGEAELAFLLNATRPDEIFAVADAGDRMPQKSTYFYPKLGTGLVLYAMDSGVLSSTA
jgi:uncharacterized protein (DUF1015 family)